MVGSRNQFLIFCVSCVFCASCVLAADDLGSPDFTVRERATRALLSDPSVDLDALRERFAGADSLEVRHRLLNVIRHHVIRQAREQVYGGQQADFGAAIGFSHEVLPAALVPHPPDMPYGGAVHVLATLPGFPGHAHFQPGDLIVEVDGKTLPPDLTAETFQRLLHGFKAGDMLTFTALRYGEPVRIQLRLASLEALTSMYGNDPQLNAPYLRTWLAVRDELLQLAPPVAVLTVRSSSHP